MKLTGEARMVAKRMLFELLADGPKKTGDLYRAMMRSFYTNPGGEILSLWQIRTLLRESGQVKEEPYSYGGLYSTTFWTLKPTDQ